MVGIESLDIKLNYYALAVAILGEYTIEMAFERLQSEHPDAIHPYQTLTPEDSEDMRKMRDKGMQYKDIVEIYHTKMDVVWKRINKTGRVAS